MIVGLVLAGGSGTRLGGVDKALLPLGGRAIVDFVLERLVPQVGAVALSANGDPERYRHLGLPVLADDIVGRGPMGGVLRGLAWAATECADALLTIPGDTPFIPHDLVRRLGPPPAWAESATGLHPLVALWPVGCAPALATWLAAQPSGRVRAFGELIGMRARQFADTPDPFHNVNTPDDLAAARARV
jgi:molybdopterin-guanine dinucleotide biosynthesis protein A